MIGNGNAALDNNSNYVGKFKHGLFHGKGRFTWPDGVIYEGDFEYGKYFWNYFAELNLIYIVTRGYGRQRILHLAGWKYIRW